MRRNAVAVLFYLAALYDFILGAAFLIDPQAMFTRFQVPFPNHWGYVQFPGALLMIFALMFFAVARAQEKNRNLIPYGILFKLAYAGVIFAYWISPHGIMPDMWKPFAVADFIFAILFARAYFSISAGENA